MVDYVLFGLCFVHLIGLFLPYLPRTIYSSMEAISFVTIILAIYNDSITIIAWNEIIRDLFFGIIIGQSIFLLGIWLITKKKKDIINFILPVKILYSRDLPKNFFYHFITALYEEIVWRVGIVLLWFPSLAGVGVSTFFFIIKHKESIVFSKMIKWDFRIYSFLSAIIYHYTHSYIILVMLHTIRNINIIYYENKSY